MQTNQWRLKKKHGRRTNSMRPEKSSLRGNAQQAGVEDLEDFEATIQKLVKVPLKQNQFDALVSWVYNLGGTNLRRSTLLQRINDDSDSSRADIPYQIKRWNRADGKVLDGLVRRREAEALLWQGEDWEDV